MEWNVELYDSKHDFVYEYGKELLQYIPNNEKLVILDLGRQKRLSPLPRMTPWKKRYVSGG